MDRPPSRAKKGASFDYGGEYDEISQAPRRGLKSGEYQESNVSEKGEVEVDPRTFRSQKLAEVKSREEHAFHQAVSKCSYLDLKYDSLFLKPGLSFYQWMARKQDDGLEEQKGASGVHFNIPDTIIYGYENQPIWLYTGKNGFIQRAETFTESAVLKKFRGLISKDSDLTAVVKKPDPSTNGKTNIASIVTLSELRSIMNPILAPNKTKMVIQLYIKPKGPKVFLIRVDWDRNRTSCAWNISNKKNLIDHDDGDHRHYLVDLSRTNSASIVRMSGRPVDHLVSMSQQIVQSLEKIIRPSLKFQGMVIDLIKDDLERWWIIQVKAFRLDSLSLSRLSGSSFSDSRPQTPLDASHPTNSKDESVSRPKSATSVTRPYIKLVQCRACRARYPHQEIQHMISTHMLLETVEHLKKRGKMLPWFDMLECDTLHGTMLITYDNLKICSNCYNLYVLEQKLVHIERQFSTIINIPQLQGTEQREEHAKVFQEYEVPNGLKCYRLLVFLKTLEGVPNLSELFGGNSFHITYKVLGRSIKIPLGKESPAHMDIFNLRIFHFFMLDHGGGIREYFKRSKPFELQLANSESATPCLSVPVPLQHFATSPSSTIDLTPILMARGEALYFCAHITMAYSECHFANPQMAGPLKLISGAYVPPSSFYTCDPLPDNWLSILANARNTAQDSSAEASAEIVRDEDREFIHWELDTRENPGHFLKEVKLWVLKIQLHSIDNLDLSSPSHGWSVHYTIFDRTSRFDIVYDRNGTGVFVGESSRIYLRASGRSLRTFFLDQNPLGLLLVKGNALFAKTSISYRRIYDEKCIDGPYEMVPPQSMTEDQTPCSPQETNSPVIRVSLLLSCISMTDTSLNTAPQVYDNEQCPLPPEMEIERSLGVDIQLLRFRYRPPA